MIAVSHVFKTAGERCPAGDVEDPEGPARGQHDRGQPVHQLPLRHPASAQRSRHPLHAAGRHHESHRPGRRRQDLPGQREEQAESVAAQSQGLEL